MSTAPAVDPAELAATAGDLRLAVHRLAHALRRPTATFDLTPSRYAALVFLEKHGRVRPGDLAASMGISRPTVSRLADTLQEAGLVDHEPDPEDGRASLLSLNDHGATMLDRVRREATLDLQHDLAAMEEADRATVTAAIPLLLGIAERQLARVREGDRASA